MSTDTQQSTQDKSSSGVWPLIWFFLFAFLVLILLIFWPLTKQLVPGLADKPSIEALGKVQEVTFVGGVVSRTQVRTSTRTVLLVNAFEIPLDTEVERHSTSISDQLCVTGSDRCSKIVSR